MKSENIVKLALLLLLSGLQLFSMKAVAQDVSVTCPGGASRCFEFSVDPSPPTAGITSELVMTVKTTSAAFPPRVDFVNVADFKVNLTISTVVATCGFPFPCFDTVTVLRFPLGRLPAGTYQVVDPARGALYSFTVGPAIAAQSAPVNSPIAIALLMMFVGAVAWRTLFRKP
jgi:hypothetical protein